MYRDCLKFFVVLFPLIGGMATLQHMWVMELAFTPRFYTVPLVVSVIVACLAAKLRDVTRKAEAQRWEAALTESQRLRAIGMFAFTVANDLRGVVQGIRWGVDSQANGGDQQVSAQVIAQSLARGEQVVGELLSLAQEDDSDKARFDLIELMHEVQASATALAAGRAELVCHWSPELELPVLGNRNQLSQAILNLVVNALQATVAVAEASVAVMVAARGREVAITIEDNGPGLPEAVQNRLFQPLNIPGEARGAGLGLYFSHQIVDRHDGDIAYSRLAAGGAAFTITLPRVV